MHACTSTRATCLFTVLCEVKHSERVHPVGLEVWHGRKRPVLMASRHAFAVWGCGTGVGKTLVSAGIVRAAAAAARKILYLKPVQTGFPADSDGELVARLASGQHTLGVHAAEIAQQRAALSPLPMPHCRTLFAWTLAVSPHLAVGREGRPVSDHELLKEAERELDLFHTDQSAFTLTETAGGVASPGPSGKLQCDVLAPLGLPAILVADGRLGGISASICAAESLRSRGHQLAATVLIDGGLQNEEVLRVTSACAGQAVPVFVLPRLREPHEEGTELGPERLTSWLDASEDVWGRLLAYLLEWRPAAHESRPAAHTPAAQRVEVGAEVAEAEAADAEAEAAEAEAAEAEATERLLEADVRLLWHPYTNAVAPSRCLAVKSARGVKLKLEDGRQLIDGMSSWWSAVHGYRVPELDRAAVEQIGRMSHVMFGGLTHAPAVELARRLVDLSPAPLQRVFLCDSGSVSVEVAMKMALQYWRARGITGRTKLLTARGGYHGDTFGAMGVCDPVNGMHAEMFSGAIASHLFVPRPRTRYGETWDGSELDEMSELLSSREDIAAVILEPIVQGAGGMHMYSPAYLRRVRSLCDDHGVLLILDCIATGFGRTGKMFACEHAAVSPDIMCLGKALTGGYMTLGATLATQEVALGVSGGRDHPNPVPLMHGPTFMANPLACAVACASVDLLLSSPWEQRVGAIQAQLREELTPLSASPAVHDVRVLGAIGVVEMEEPLQMTMAQACLVDRGVWLRPFGRLLYTMPPFVTSAAELSSITSAMRAVVEAVESTTAARER